MSRMRWLPTLSAVGRKGAAGMTAQELRAEKGWHHGVASGILSNLHREGRLARLAEKRDGYKIYTTPEHVGGRDAERYGRGRRPPKEQP